MGKSSSPPPAPDYNALAQQQGAANVQAIRVGSRVNNPRSVTTPYGQQTVTFAPGGDRRATIVQSLSPAMQALFDQNNRISGRLGDLAETGTGFVENMLQNPFNQGSLPRAPVNAGRTAQEAIMRRLEPQLQNQRSQLEQNLANRGVPRDSAAWNQAFEEQSQRENDLLSQASLMGINEDQESRQNSIQEQSYFRNEPLNILNAVRSGVQIGQPQFQQYANQGSPGAAPIFQAGVQQNQDAVNRYNANQAGNGNFMSGLMSLGGTLGGAAMSNPWMFSDRRLKENIERIGTHPEGFGIYSFTYIGSDDPQVGYMADEVEQIRPDAVREILGFKAVNYGAL